MRVYLDNAATSWPKPEAVYAAVDRYMREIGAAAGRSGYRDATEAQRLVDATRRECAGLLGVADSTRIVFAANGTDALNLAIHGVLRAGDHVVTTVCEHNSVLRPLAEAGRTTGVETTYVECDGQGIVDPNDVQQALRSGTRLVVVTHASNVTGAIQPVREIAAVAHEVGALVLIDAAQTAGHMPVDVGKLGADLLAASGHKGLLGPLGTAILYIRPGLEMELRPVRQGGTGVESQLDHQPAEMPFRFEAGNLNTPALAGLGAAVRFLHERGVAETAAHEAALAAHLREGLTAVPGVRVYGPASARRCSAVVSFNVQGYDPQEFAAALDSAAGVQCRAGLHCAPRMHKALGTLESGGLVRLSLGWATTDAEVDHALAAIAAIAVA